MDQINWGGLNLLFLGDMLQLQPPSNFAKSIYVDCVDETLGFDKFNKDTQLYHGVSVFRRFKKFELTTQNRASRDKGHTTMIHRLRTNKKPITPEMLKKLKPLGTDDMKSLRWKFAPRLVTGNLERFLINKHQVLAFARETGRTVYTWVDSLSNVPFHVSSESDETLDPSARRYFVYGAPAYITENLNTAATGIVNGSKGYLHSLTWRDEDARAEQLPPPGSPGEAVEIPVPLTVNVYVPDIRGAPGYGKIVPCTTTENETKNADATLKRARHTYDLGFSVTYHKVQGQTLDAVVLVLHKRKPRQLLSLCFEMFYVAVTRVRQTKDIRILYFAEEEGDVQPKKRRKKQRTKTSAKYNGINPGLHHLLDLRRPRHFDAWLQSYDKYGNWDDAQLHKQRAEDRARAVRVLKKPAPLTTYNVRQLGAMVKAMGLTADKAPGKSYANKPQLLAALFPEWVRARPGRKMPEGMKRKPATAGNKSREGHKGRQRRQPSGARTSKTHTQKSKGRRQLPSGPRTPKTRTQKSNTPALGHRPKTTATRQRGKRQSAKILAVATVTMDLVEALRTPNAMVSSDVLVALCKAKLQPCNEKITWFDTFCIPYRGLDYNWARIHLCDQRLALAVLQPTTRLLIPIFASCHYSLLDVDMGTGVIRHHDSLKDGHQRERKVEEWYQMAKNMVECFRQKNHWSRQPEMQVAQPFTRLHTQKGGTMTCLVHTFHYMITIQQYGEPRALDDRIANTTKRNELYNVLTC